MTRSLGPGTHNFSGPHRCSDSLILVQHMGEDEIERALLILKKLWIDHWWSLFELYSVPYQCKTGPATYFLFVVQLLQTRFDFWCSTDSKVAVLLTLKLLYRFHLYLKLNLICWCCKCVLLQDIWNAWIALSLGLEEALKVILDWFMSLCVRYWGLLLSPIGVCVLVFPAKNNVGSKKVIVL